MNDTTGTYDTYLFYIAKLYPDITYDIIKNMDEGENDPQLDPERKRIGLLASLYTAFPPLIQKQIFDYILKVLPDSLKVDYLVFFTNNTATAKNLVAIIKMAFQLDPDDRKRIRTIIKTAYYKILHGQRTYYDNEYLRNVYKILYGKNKTSINRFINSYDFYCHFGDKIYYTLNEWLLKQVPSTDFARIIGLAGTWRYHFDYITWIKQQFYGRMDVSLIDKALYDMFVCLIEEPLTDLELISDIIKASSTIGIASLHEVIHQKQLEGRTEFITQIQLRLYYNHESLYRETDFPDYLPVKTVQELLVERFLFGKPVPENWVKDLLVTLPVELFDEVNDSGTIYSEILAIAPYTALITSLQENKCIDLLLKLLIYIRANKLSMPFFDCDNENVAERTYIALLKLVPKMTSEQSLRFENTVLEDLSFNNDHTREIAKILFRNRALIGEQLANRLINMELFNVKNMRLLIVMRAERYTCTPELTTKTGPTPQ